MPKKLDFQTIKNLKKPGRYTDALVKGLHIWVKPNGGKYWIFRYSYNTKPLDISLGVFPALTVAEARLKAEGYREELRKDINPIEAINALKAKNQPIKTEKVLFKEFALECVKTKQAEWRNMKHRDQWLYTLKEFAFPIIGNKELDQIDTEDIRKILIPIWIKMPETASRLRGRLEWILAAATAREFRSGMNPALWRGHLQMLLPTTSKFHTVKHHKALHYRMVPSFISQLREIDRLSALALEFLILNASRTGEVINGYRSEIEDNLWTIPASRMKAKKEHRVPLTQRSLEILEIAKAMDPDSPYLFSNNGKPLSNMAMSMILKRLHVDATVHGFRSSFRDWVSEETDYSSEVAEMALAHTIRNKVEKAYRRNDLLEKRRSLMAAWEKYCSNSFMNITTLKAA